jgi:hypothetical protein
MSLIKTKTGFNGLCDVKHEIYRPFYNAKVFFNKPLTPYGQAAEAQNVDENVEVHASDDDNANVGNMGHANVDEDAYDTSSSSSSSHAATVGASCWIL